MNTANALKPEDILTPGELAARLKVSGCAMANIQIDKRMPMGVEGDTMKRTNIWLADKHLKGLKKLSAKTGAPVSELVRRAIEEYLAKKHK